MLMLSGCQMKTDSIQLLAPGDQRLYEFTYENASETDLQPLFAQDTSAQPTAHPPGAPRQLHVFAGGRLRVVCLEKQQDTTIVGFSFSRLVIGLEKENMLAEQEAEKVRSDLQQRLFALVSPRGNIEKVWLDPYIEDLSENYARALLSLLQVVVPPDGWRAQGEWTVEEEDLNGRFMAVYVVEKNVESKNDPAVFSIKKIKKEYLADLAQAGPMQTRIIPKGHTVIRMDAKKGTILSLEGEENQQVWVKEKVVSNSFTQFRFDLLESGKSAPAEWESYLESWKLAGLNATPVSLAFNLSAEEAERMIQREALKDATLTDLQQSLNQLAKEGKTSDLDLYLQFKALIFMQPEVCDTLADWLMESPAASLSMNTVPHALAEIGHQEAQTALTKVLKARKEEKAVLSTLVEVTSLIDQPNEEVIDAILSVSQETTLPPEVRENALLSLGRLANSLLVNDPDRAEELVAYLEKGLSDASGMTDQLLYITALGNTGHDRLPSVLEPYLLLEAPPWISAAACSALRLVKDKKADEVLLQILDDPRGEVKKSAIRTIGSRPPYGESFTALQHIVLNQQESSIRLLALDVLWRQREVYPEQLQQLLITLANSPDTANIVTKEAQLRKAELRSRK